MIFRGNREFSTMLLPRGRGYFSWVGNISIHIDHISSKLVNLHRPSHTLYIVHHIYCTLYITYIVHCLTSVDTLPTVRELQKSFLTISFVRTMSQYWKQSDFSVRNSSHLILYSKLWVLIALAVQLTMIMI